VKLTAKSRRSLILSLNRNELRVFYGKLLRPLTPVVRQKWEQQARSDQRPPPDDEWIVWLLLAARSFGKTRIGGSSACRDNLAGNIAQIGPTAADAWGVTVKGESGLLAVHPDEEAPIYEPSNRRLIWENRAIATCYSANEPQRLRGPQHDFASGRD
jgi:phage terminase large subunit-like protein